MSYDDAISFHSLYQGLKLSQRNVIWKDSVAGYSLNGLKNTYKLRKSLINNSYRLSAYHRFLIKEPKERDILATHISDRQFQRSLCDNELTPTISKSFIRDNVACLKGHGVDDGVNRLKEFFHKFYINHGLNGYILKCDIKGYFPNTRFDIAQNKIIKHVPDLKSAARACEIIESFCESSIMDELCELGLNEYTAHNLAHYISNVRCAILVIKICNINNQKEINKYKTKIRKRILQDLPTATDEFIQHVTNDVYRGIGLGSQASQLTELLMLNDLDHFIKEKLHIKYYIRYMDDFILIHQDKEYLQYCLKEITSKLKEVDLYLNNKTKIFQLKQGVTFLKWRYIITDTGKVLLRMKKKKITKQRKKLRKLKNLYDECRISIEDVRNNFRSWQANAEKGDTYHVISRMRNYYKELFKEDAPYGTKYFKQPKQS